MRRIGLVLAASLALAVLAMVRPGPPVGEPAPQDAIVVAATWTAWLAAGYLSVGLALIAATARSRRPSNGLLPSRVSRVVRRAVGAGAAAAVVGTGLAATAPALADAHRPHRPSISATWPLAPHPRHAVGVVVRPGDCLWTLTADVLRHPSSARVAATWPRWWRANRAVIGSDPDLIQPGQRLRPPTTSRRPT